jgi:release factor glutamine methyltransferase
MNTGPLKWTVRSTLQWTTDYLRKHTVDSPRLDAELLLAHTLEIRRLDLYLDPDRPLVPVELARFKDLVKQRTQQKRSMAHIIGSKEFYAVKLQTPPGVFVPRPETEALVEECLLRLPTDSSARLLDLCTGTGAIAIAILSERQGMQGDAVELTEIGASTARGNAAELGLEDRLMIHCGDASNYLAGCTTRYDLVTCNPPYIPSRDVDHLMPEVLNHEPRQALDGGVDGLDLFRTLIPQIPAVLSPEGFLIMEYDGSHQTQALQGLLGDAGFAHSTVRKDLAGHHRLLIARFKEAS